MSQSPEKQRDFDYQSGYADAARQLNMLVRSGRSYSGHERNCCFLNVPGGQFANASMVSGFDFPEDGRAVAVCDWDQDGDLDFWVANRTAPQLRLMKNRLSSSGNHIAFQLTGTKSNRDAIGARVSVSISASGTKRSLSRTVRAGEGFLACGSRRVHFGLGNAERVEEVKVRWPNGNRESFGSLGPNAVWKLVEGRGEPEKHYTQPQTLAAQVVELPEQSMATENVVTDPIPCPPLRHERYDGTEVDLSAPNDRPTLVNLWATWCQPCLIELTEWSASELPKEVRVVPLCVDSLGGEKGALTGDEDTGEAKELISLLGLEEQAGNATSGLLDVLQHVHNVVYDHHRPLPVPTSALLDEDGQLCAIYKGSVSPDRILSDVRQLKEGDRLTAGLPFKGRWLGGLRGQNIALVVEDLFRAGYDKEARVLVDRLEGEKHRPAERRARLFLAKQLEVSDPAAATQQLQALLERDSGNASAHERMALIVAKGGDPQKAIRHFEWAIEHGDPPRARSHYNFGRLLRTIGDSERATKEFDIALEVDREFAEAHEQLGLMAAERQDYVRAANHFKDAVSADPRVSQYSVNLALALNRLGRNGEAWAALRSVLSRPKPPSVAVLMGARSLEAMKKYPAAIEMLERYLQLEPEADDIRQHLQKLKGRTSTAP